MSNKPARPKPRVVPTPVDLKPKPRAGGRIDSASEVFIFRYGRKFLHLLRGNIALAVFLLACAGALVFILCISYCHAGGPTL